MRWYGAGAVGPTRSRGVDGVMPVEGASPLEGVGFQHEGQGVTCHTRRWKEHGANCPL
jgi:hypothetical protein